MKLCVNIPFPYSLLYSYFIHIFCILHCSHISCSSYSFNFITSLTWACWLSPIVDFYKKVSQLYQSFDLASLLYLLHSPKINNRVQGWMISKEMHNMANPLSTFVFKYIATIKVMTLLYIFYALCHYHINSQDAYDPLTT